MNYKASKYTHVAASSTDSLIESGNNITVFGIIASNSSGGGTVTLEEANTSTVIAIIEILAGDSFESSIVWLADQGLQVTTDASTVCTIFHSQVGA